MALVIKYLSQPHAGREITVPDGQDEVKFGRATDADVGFPPELDIVSRDHFRLRREVGVYKFVISRDLPVFSGGRALLDGEELDTITEVQLSGPTGPRLRIEAIDEAASNIPKTQVLKRGQDIGDFADATKKGGRRLAGWLAGVTVAAIVVAAGYFLLRQDVGALKAELPSIAEQIAKTSAAAAGRVDAAGIIEKNKESVYQVQLRMPSGTVVSTGTASVVLMPDGTKALATNAHVAEMFIDLANDPSKAGFKVVVVQPKAPDYPTYEVTRAILHPFWKEHDAWVNRIMALTISMAGQNIKPITGYDVGLMFIADQSKLGEPLKYASRDEIKAIRTGDPLVLIGYAAEGVRGTDEMRPEPTSQTGIITSMTTFYLYRGTDEDDQLIQHSVPATGGASGSPMFNANGEVVGFLFAGNVADVAKDGTRMISAALVNYAIRADLLLDMVDGAAEGKLAGYRKQAVEAEARYKKTPEAYLADMATMFGSEVAGDAKGAVEVGTVDLALDQSMPGSATGKYGARELTLEPGMAYLVIGMSADGRPIGVILLDANQKIIGGGPTFAYVSHAVINNAEAKLPKLLWAVLDTASLQGSPIAGDPGKVKVHIYKAPVRSGRGH